MDSSERRTRIRANLGIEPIIHGQVHTFQIAIPESQKQGISAARRQLIADSLTEYKSNLVPLIVRQTTAYSEEKEYEVVYGADWCVVAQELEIEKLWVWVFDMTDEQARAAMVEMEQLVNFSSHVTVTPSASEETQQLETWLQKIERLLQRKWEDIDHKISQLHADYKRDPASSSEKININQLSTQIEQIIDRKLEHLVNQSKEIRSKPNDFDYQAMTVDQLRAIAQKRQIKNRSKLKTKAQLVAAIIDSEATDIHAKRR